MTDRTVLAFNPELLSGALWHVSDLMLRDRVHIAHRFEADLGLIDTVTVEVTGLPDVRDELVAALGNPEHHDWQTKESSDRTYRDWRGVLLTMPITVTEILPGPDAAIEPEPPASDPAGDVVPSPAPVPICLGIDTEDEAGCGELGPHKRHELGEDPVPMVDPLFECPDCGHHACICPPAAFCEHNKPARICREFHTEPPEPEWHKGCTWCWRTPWHPIVAEPEPVVIPGPYDKNAVRSDLVIRRAFPDGSVPEGLVRADAETLADPVTAAAWRTYAVERFRTWVEGSPIVSCRTLADAIGVVDAWQGRMMLTDEDAAMLARELLVDPAPAPRIRIGPYVQWAAARIAGRKRNRSNRHRDVAGVS